MRRRISGRRRIPGGIEAASPGSSPAAFSQSGEPKEASLVLDNNPIRSQHGCKQISPIRRITLEQMSEFPNLRASGKSRAWRAPPVPSESNARAIGATSDTSPFVYKHTGGSEFATPGANARS